MRRLWILAAAACLLLVQSAAPLSAADPLRDKLTPVAHELLATLKQLKQTNVSVGEFTGPEDLKAPANYGPGIAEALTAILNELRPGVVKADAAYSIGGRYEQVIEHNEQLDSDLVNVRVTAQLTDGNGQLIDGDAAVAEIRDSATIAQLLGVTVALPALGSTTKRNESVVAALESQEAGRDQGIIDGTKVRSSERSRYAVEILAAPADKSPKTPREWQQAEVRQPRFENGAPFVDLARDEVYAVRIYNQDEYDAAVYLHIDGLNVFHFTNPEFRTRDGRPKYQYYIIEKGSPGFRTLTGWHRTNQESDSFLVTGYGSGAASQNLPAEKQGEVGTITVSFAMAWTGNEPPTGLLAQRATVETGFGPSTQLKLNEVKRHIGTVDDVVVIRYSH